MPNAAVISVLARSLLAGEQSLGDVYARAVRTLGRPRRWLRPLVRRYLEAFGNDVRPRHRDVVQWLRRDAEFSRVRTVSIAEWLAEPQRMQPVAAVQQWNLPVIESTGDLAKWLSVTTDELEWFADLKGLGYKPSSSKLQHYYYVIREKRSGGVRLIESPKSRIKELQRRILSEILDLIPVHPVVHGFVKRRSIVSFATPHTGKRVLLRIDLQNFFPAFPAARVQALFRTLGYPEPVADRLGGICTNAVPRAISRETGALYTRRHLPQGAPTSPAIANLTAYRLDCRLSGLAKSAGAVYTRYADDLAFSGDEEFERVVERFSIHVAAIALEEGFSVNHRKTRFMRRGVRQHLAGVSVNETVSLRRRDLEILEAILTNCVHHGPESQNRSGVPDFRAHLEGRVGFVEMVNRVKGQRLRALFEGIHW